MHTVLLCLPLGFCLLFFFRFAQAQGPECQLLGYTALTPYLFFLGHISQLGSILLTCLSPWLHRCLPQSLLTVAPAHLLPVREPNVASKRI